MPTWLAPLLLSLADAFPRIAALFTRAPVPEPSTPAPPGWAGIEGEEDRAAAARAATPTEGAPHAR